MEDLHTGAPAPRTVDAGRGLTWWSDAWALFLKAPGMWVVLGLILMVLLFAMSVVPLLGSIAAALLTPVFGGGWMMAARKVEAGGALEVGDLFTGFGEKLKPLLILGLLFLAATVLMGLLIGAVGLGAGIGFMMGGMHRSGAGMAAAMGVGMLAGLVSLVLVTLLTMATWFAVPLVVFDGVAPMDAVSASFSASVKNLVAFLLYGLLYIIAAVIASIPAGLGWLVLVPLTLLTVYVSYKHVFGAMAA